MGCKLIESYSKSSFEYGVGEKTFKIHKFETTPFHAFSLGTGQIKFQFGNVKSTTMTYEI
jgi:hypothetical protein